MQWIHALLDWVQANDVLLWWLFAFSAATFVLSPLLVAWVVVRLPADYFSRTRRRPLGTWERRFPVLRPVAVVAKNALGVVLLLAGAAMLIFPGQGLLTIVIALMLLDFPGKFRFQRWLVTRRPVWRSINWLRRRSGHKTLERPA